MTSKTSELNSAPGYSILIPEDTLARTIDYLKALRAGQTRAGALLDNHLRGVNLHSMNAYALIGKLFDTKQPQIFAETAVVGDGSDWNLTELGLLGDISVAMRVTIFDNGRHSNPVSHSPAFFGELVFTPGALLCNGRGHTAADWNEVTTSQGRLSLEGFFNLYSRRLLPVFRYINERAGKPGTALVTVPGLGCGQFAGPFSGQLGGRLQEVLRDLLTEYGTEFPNIKCVYFDPYNECENLRCEIHGISFMVRPLQAPGNQAKSQLCCPVAYEDEEDDFSACRFFSIVAWDHVSWPGNDFFGGARATDDGVKAAATNSMSVVTNIEGQYDLARGEYLPPEPYATWGDVVNARMRQANLRLWDPLAVWQSL